MSLLDRLEVPEARSRASTRATRRPRDAASRAAPAPVTPPPMTSTSNRSAASRSSTAPRSRASRAPLPAITNPQIRYGRRPGASTSSTWPRRDIAGEIRRALGDEGADAFRRCAVREQSLLQQRLAAEPLVRRQLEGGVDRPDDRQLRRQRGGHQFGRQGERLLDDIAVGEPVDQANGQRLGRRDLAGGQHDVQGPAPSHEPGQSLGAAGSGDEAELDLGQAEPPPGAAHPHRARHRELQPAAERQAVHRGDRDPGSSGQPVVDVAHLVAVGHKGVCVDGGHVLNVGPCGEEAVQGRGYDRDLDVVGPLGRVDGGVQSVQDRHAEGVGRRPVQRHDPDPGALAAPGNDLRWCGHGAPPISTAQAIVRPPLTESVWPVTKPAPSEARKATAGPMSSGVPSRFIGTARAIPAMTFSASPDPSAKLRRAGVSVGPGQTVLAVTPFAATSRARVLVNAMMPPFAPEYTASSDEPTRPASDPMLMTRPKPRSVIPGTTALMTRSAPLKLMSRILSQNSSVVLTNGMKSSQPALFTTTSTGPRAASTARTADSTEAVRVTSISTAMAVPPAAVISLAVCSAVVRFRSATATLNPAAASAEAMPLPIPWAPPVTMATRLLMRFSCVVVRGQRSAGSQCTGPATMEWLVSLRPSTDCAIRAASMTASRSRPVSTPISWNMLARSSVAILPVEPTGTGQPPSSPKLDSKLAQPASSAAYALARPCPRVLWKCAVTSTPGR